MAAGRLPYLISQPDLVIMFRPKTTEREATDIDAGIAIDNPFSDRQR